MNANKYNRKLCIEASITKFHAVDTTFALVEDLRKERRILEKKVAHLVGQRPQQPRWLENWTVLMCVQDNAEVRFLSPWVSERGGLAIRAGRCREMVDFFGKPKDYPCMILMEVTEDADLNDVIDRCLDLRKASPASPIILLSREFGHDELSTLRLEICDASLRMPVLQSAFEDVVLLAIQNNGTYCHRKNIERPFTTLEMLERVRPEPVFDQEYGDALAHSGQWLGPTLLLGIVFWLSVLLWIIT